jgi:hypothetical protein
MRQSNALVVMKLAQMKLVGLEQARGYTRDGYIYLASWIHYVQEHDIQPQQ